MDKVAVINQKGGVGKTTTTVNLGAALAERGARVLLIDLDPQANLGTHLGIDPNEPRPTIYDVLVSSTPIADVVVPSAEANISVVPSNLDLSAAEMELVSMMGRETLLRDAFEDLERNHPDAYDVVLMDCPPSLGVLSINALAAAQDVLVPLQAEFFALQGMAKLTEIIQLVQRRLNPALALRGIVACKVDKRTRLTNEVLDEVGRYFGPQLFKTMIRPNVKLAEAPSYGQTVLGYAADSNGAEDYRRLAREWCGEVVEEPVAVAAAEGDESEDDGYEYVYEYVYEEETEGDDAERDAEDAPEAISEPAPEIVPELPAEVLSPVADTVSVGRVWAAWKTVPLPRLDLPPARPARDAQSVVAPVPARETVSTAELLQLLRDPVLPNLQPSVPRRSSRKAADQPAAQRAMRSAPPALTDPRLLGNLVRAELPPHCWRPVPAAGLRARPVPVAMALGERPFHWSTGV